MSSTTTPSVETFLSGIVGKRCWRVGDAYGGQLALDLGGRRRLKLRKNIEHGEWRIQSQASDWSAVAAGGILVASWREPINRAIAALKALEGVSVSSAVVLASLSLEVAFDNGIRIDLEAPKAPYDDDLDYWEVIGPNKLVLIAKTSVGCRLYRSDVPFKDQTP